MHAIRAKKIPDVLPELFLAILILIQFIFTFLSFPTFLLLQPRLLDRLPGILFSPLIHADVEHLSGNLVLFIPCALLLLLLYRQQVVFVLCVIQLICGLLTWLFATNGIHIGYSGVTIGLFMYLVFAGFFSYEWKRMCISCVIALWQLYLFHDIWFSADGISADAHVCGAISGVLLSWIIYRPLHYSG